MARVDRAQAPERKTQATVGIQAERHVTTENNLVLDNSTHCMTVSVGKGQSEINGWIPSELELA